MSDLASRTRYGNNWLSWLSRNQGLLFLAPALALYAVFVLYPGVFIFYASMLEWDGVNPGVFVGFENFTRLFVDDRSFHLALRNSLYWTLLTIFPQMFLGFIIAYILTSGIPFEKIFRAIFYIPAIISPIVIGIIWQRIYNPFGGLISDIGFATGLKFLAVPFLADPDIAIFSVIVVNIWEWTGFSMLLYIAGLQSIPDDIRDATKVAGATTWQAIRFVFWPMMRHVHLTLILLGVIGTLQTFPLIFIMTGGGPNHATEMLPNYIFQQAFQLQSTGYASAISVTLLVIALGLCFFQVRVLGARFALTN